MGGEYPSIHFRTGQLGQGSKTALPIFGEFIQQVLSDEHFSKYRVKFPPAKGLDPRLWTGSSYSYYRPDTASFDYDFSASSNRGEPAASSTTEEVQVETSEQEESAEN